MDVSQNMGGNACAWLDPVDRQKLQEAAETLVAARGIIMKITETVGTIISRAESDDDDADAGYWITRSGLSHVTIELLIRQVTARFGVVLSEKILTQVVPVAGMLAGAGLNYAFIDYYQQMARVHFTIRDVERRAPDPSAVRPCFSHLVREVRRRRKPQRSRQEPAAK